MALGSAILAHAARPRKSWTRGTVRTRIRARNGEYEPVMVPMEAVMAMRRVAVTSDADVLVDEIGNGLLQLIG